MPEVLLEGSAKIIVGIIAGLLLTVLPFWHICKRTGLHPALSFLSIIPLADIVFRFYLAITKWPALEEDDSTETFPATPEKKKRKPLLITLGAFLMALAPIMVICGTVYTFTLPKIYASHALVQTVFSKNAYENYDAATLAGLTQTYTERITAKPILYETISRLNLQSRWGRNGEKIPKEFACKILKSSIQVYRHRDSTDLTTITVRRQDPDETARLANMLAAIYQETAENDTTQAEPYSIVIVDSATPPIRPVSPNLPLNILISLGVACVFILAGTPLLIIGLRR